MYIFDILIFVAIWNLVLSIGVLNISLTCNYAKINYQLAGFNRDEDINNQKKTGRDLKVCSPEMTCCNVGAERNLVQASERLQGSLQIPVYKNLSEALLLTSTNFMEIFRKFMNKSQKNLDTMFEETYGSRYENNNYVFKSLYHALHQYINGSELDLETTVDLFFAKLHEKIYVMSHPFSKFDKKFENCINENTNFVRPFGEIQQLIRQQTSRSFMAARMFLHSLKEANNIVSELSQMAFHDECSVAFMRMTQCSICSDVPSSIKPCLNYCQNVMKGCFSYIIMIQPKWNDFLINLITLAQKLEGPFSIEAVVEPLGVKISEAIMIFQENQGNITAKVEEKCGKPTPNNNIELSKNKKRRSALLKGEMKLKSSNLPLIFNVDSDKKKVASELESLLIESQKTFRSLIHHWLELPEKICNDELFSASNEVPCWNGMNSSGYEYSVVTNSIEDLFKKNPEVKSNPLKANMGILNLDYKLGLLIKGVQKALAGKIDPECPDCENGESSSGSSADGSGDGSGDKDNESGSGDEATTTIPNHCDNSVDDDCVSNKNTHKTKNTEESKNDIHIYEPIINLSTSSSATDIFLNLILILLGLTAFGIL